MKKTNLIYRVFIFIGFILATIALINFVGAIGVAVKGVDDLSDDAAMKFVTSFDLSIKVTMVLMVTTAISLILNFVACKSTSTAMIVGRTIFLGLVLGLQAMSFSAMQILTKLFSVFKDISDFDIDTVRDMNPEIFGITNGDIDRFENLIDEPAKLAVLIIAIAVAVIVYFVMGITSVYSLTKKNKQAPIETPEMM